MKAIDIIKKLKKIKRKAEKEQLVREAWENNCTEFFEGVEYAYNKDYSFSFPRVPEIEDIHDLPEEEWGNPEDFTWGDFKSILDQHLNGLITADEAKEKWNDAAEIAHVYEWNEWYRRILQRNLKCGLTKKTVDNVLETIRSEQHHMSLIDQVVDTPKPKPALVKPDTIVPDIASEQIPSPEPLPKPVVDKPEPIEQLNLSDPVVHMATQSSNTSLGVFNGTKYVDPDLDGRCIIIIDRKNNKVQGYDAWGTLMELPKHIHDSLKLTIDMIPVSIALDGFLIKKNFANIITATPDEDKEYFAIQDMLSKAEWENKICKKPLSRRHQMIMELGAMLQRISDRFIYILPKLQINVKQQGMGNLNFFKDELKSAGITHYIVKDTESVYNVGHQQSWVKVPV